MPGTDVGDVICETVNACEVSLECIKVYEVIAHKLPVACLDGGQGLGHDGIVSFACKLAQPHTAI